jgi:hypothetical protein
VRCIGRKTAPQQQQRKETMSHNAKDASYVYENFDGTFELQTPECDHICFVETFSEDTPIEEIRSQGYVPILECYPDAKIRCHLGSEDLFVQV